MRLSTLTLEVQFPLGLKHVEVSRYLMLSGRGVQTYALLAR